jgi:hypothetical protein
VVDEAKVNTTKGNVEIADLANRGHTSVQQCWITTHNGAVITFYLAHAKGALGVRGIPKMAQDTNRFFFKHVLMPSKKGTSVRDKAYKRQDRREDADARANAAAKRQGGGGLSIKAKFADRAKDERENTVLDLNEILAPRALECFRDSIVNFAWGRKDTSFVDIDFHHPCVRQTDNFDRLYSSMKVRVAKINDTTYDIFHCECAL